MNLLLTCTWQIHEDTGGNRKVVIDFSLLPISLPTLIGLTSSSELIPPALDSVFALVASLIHLTKSSQDMP